MTAFTYIKPHNRDIAFFTIFDWLTKGRACDCVYNHCEHTQGERTWQQALHQMAHLFFANHFLLGNVIMSSHSRRECQLVLGLKKNLC